MAIQTRLVEYQHDDVMLEGFLAWDDSCTAPRPGVAISHAWGGRSGFEEDKAVKLAHLGYVGFAIDMYGKGVLGSGPEENAGLMAPFLEDRQLLQDRIGAAIVALRQQAEVNPVQVVAMGYCFGGQCVLDLAGAAQGISYNPRFLYDIQTIGYGYDYNRFATAFAGEGRQYTGAFPGGDGVPSARS
jgi:dienelactone hydrolase